MAAPAAQEGARNGGLRGKDGHRDRALGGWLVLGALCDDVIAVQPLVLDALVAQELRQPLGCCYRAALAPCTGRHIESGCQGKQGNFALVQAFSGKSRPFAEHAASFTVPIFRWQQIAKSLQRTDFEHETRQQCNGLPRED